MNIKKLELQHFRNYDCASISFGSGINILYGKNAQGKTNVLEALFLSATGKSHRTNAYQDLVQNNYSGFELCLEAQCEERENQIKIRYSKEKGRSIEINDIKRDKISDILGTLNMILFSPETLEVIKGSPQIRRRFLDILLCQTSRQYLHDLQQYNQIIKNKSLALRKGKQEKKYEEIIPIWNDSLAKYGSRISLVRKTAVDKLNLAMKREINQITNGIETSELHYKSYTDGSNFEEALKEKLITGLSKEMALGQCLYGPHRDDVEIYLNDMNSRSFCSQGQQRTLALSLIIAELHYIEEIKGEKPVLLLDDVMSELDQKRQEYLVNGLYTVQTIITTTDDLPYQSIKNRDVKRFYIEAGRVFHIS
ncbi:MAG: DNA replication/repair protein RecF [Clostridia bacterium]|nr:DNA replication/repair protein RecF [Clostridia bacterium]